MKVIVSTVNFSKFIKDALNNKTFRVEIDAALNEIICYGTFPLSFKIHTTEQRQKIFSPFYEGQWLRLQAFLNQLEEQPIVIEFNDYSDGNEEIELSIELSQFIKRIK